MILRDEAANLSRSLAPVAGCFDEVVVVDTGSRDDTAHLCAQLGARVFSMPWGDDFAAARNRSIELASADWLFWLDGDNSITPQDVDILRQFIPGGNPAVIWAQEKVLSSGGRLWQKRCFPRHPQVSFQGRVHEQLDHPPHWPSLLSPVVVDHWGYCDPERNQAKGRYYLGLLEQSLEADPEDFYAQWQAARCHYNLRQFEQAARLLADMSRNPQARRRNLELWAAGHHLWAQALERLDRAREAEAVLDRVLEELPWHGVSHFQRGRLAFTRNDWSGAVRHLTLALNCGLGVSLVEIDPDKCLFLADYYLGRALEHLGRPAQAAEALSRAVQRDPGNLAARNQLARMLAGLGRPQEARQQLEHVLEIRPADRLARSLLQAMAG